MIVVCDSFFFCRLLILSKVNSIGKRVFFSSGLAASFPVPFPGYRGVFDRDAASPFSLTESLEEALLLIKKN